MRPPTPVVGKSWICPFLNRIYVPLQWWIHDFPDRKMGANPRGGKNNLLDSFCRKLHENERIWTKEGGGGGWSESPLSSLPLPGTDSRPSFSTTKTGNKNIAVANPPSTKEGGGSSRSRISQMGAGGGSNPKGWEYHPII